MSTAVVSQASLFWRKLGWWQALTIIVTLVTFSITKHLTGDKAMAGVTASLVVAVIILATGSYAAFRSFSAPLIPTAVLAIGALTVMIAQFTILFVVLVGLALILLTYEAGQCGIKKRVVWLSSVVEFITILIPILLA